MKSIFYLVISLSLIFLNSRVTFAITNPVDSPNNKVGVHILNIDEVDKARDLVNGNGGDWGYVTIPIQPTDRDKDKWAKFMASCSEKHLIPILRITTIPSGGTWEAGADTDLVDFANFLADLQWPVQNRYVIIFNEVNRATEWGGRVEPARYARILKNAYTIFKERSPDFFILAAGLDNALPASSTSMRAVDYMSAMRAEDPSIWSYTDGWNSHSYPNPAFSAPPTRTGWLSIVSYRAEQQFAKISPKPVFITETGWTNTQIGENRRAEYMQKALDIWSRDPIVVAVTPFLLTAGAGDFVPFSLTQESGDFNPTGQIIKNYPKVLGVPKGPTESTTMSKSEKIVNTLDKPGFRPNKAIIKLENLIRRLFGLPEKNLLTVGGSLIEIDVVDNAKGWEKGLSGRDKLEENAGMYFVFPNYHVPIFWMKDMNFSLDIIWLRDDEIVGFDLYTPLPDESRPLPTYSPKVPINRVLEVPAGYVEAHGLEIGQKVELITD